MGLFSAFQVYNPYKHADPQSGYKGSKNNTGSGTMFMFAKEYQEPKSTTAASTDGKDTVVTSKGMSNDPEEFKRMMDASEIANADKILIKSDEYVGEGMSRKNSNASSVTSEDGTSNIDWKHMSQNEFKKMYDSVRKGEPNNRVNR